MPDKRIHRGPHPEDRKLFSLENVEKLQAATADLSLLLTKGYAGKSSVKLVGDKFELTERQRLAIMRNACSDQQLKGRLEKQVDIAAAAGEQIVLDGYNVLITIEAAISGGVIFKGRDGCLRDLASVHGTYRKVQETMPAVELIGEFLTKVGADGAVWLLDSPVSNSGKLKSIIEHLAQEKKWNWQVRLLQNPDSEMKKTDSIVASSDSVVIETSKRWVNLAGQIVKENLPHAWMIELA